jgi:hypothetical protein
VTVSVAVAAVLLAWALTSPFGGLGAAVAGAIGGVWSVIGIVWLFQLWSYRRGGRQDSDWSLTYGGFGNGLIFFNLQARRLHALLDDLRVVECAVRGPSGLVNADGKVQFFGSMAVCRFTAETDAGSYDVRWYGSTKSGRFYEVTRATFDRDQQSTMTPRLY